ncbi:hypothetical protein SS05631_b51370 (plasmid) [Sinorhizobium sp. CCBAU 05631]|uniref:Uncharacterized protein n=1 Tax=Rhizobium fredii TaxID=380 RepID=A0A2L0HDA8_RHIFR|nr:hypothetical protein SS05631_b51370 [Sinorhizobium sp. CCBAU 05631]AUX79490.1 hypothetical protein NXT3_PC00318 [Sinorhizobium fredii]
MPVALNTAEVVPGQWLPWQPSDIPPCDAERQLVAMGVISAESERSSARGRFCSFV